VDPVAGREVERRRDVVDRIALRDDEKEVQAISRFATRAVGIGNLAARLEPLGWEAGGRAEVTGLPITFTKTFGTAATPIIVTAHTDSGCIERVTFDGRVEKLSPIAISELLYDLDRATR